MRAREGHDDGFDVSGVEAICDGIGHFFGRVPHRIVDDDGFVFAVEGIAPTSIASEDVCDAIAAPEWTVVGAYDGGFDAECGIGFAEFCDNRCVSHENVGEVFRRFFFENGGIVFVVPTRETGQVHAESVV